jgi:hypothetical protein
MVALRKLRMLTIAIPKLLKFIAGLNSTMSHRIDFVKVRIGRQPERASHRVAILSAMCLAPKQFRAWRPLCARQRSRMLPASVDPSVAQGSM